MALELGLKNGLSSRFRLWAKTGTHDLKTRLARFPG